MPYLKKGQQVYVEGTPSARAYTTQGGEAKAAIQVSVNMVTLLGGKSDAQPAAPVSDGQAPEGFYTAGTAQPQTGAGADMPTTLPAEEEPLW